MAAPRHCGRGRLCCRHWWERQGHTPRDGFGPGQGRSGFARFAALASRFAEIRRHKPTMIAIDDAHHVDGGTLQLTRFLASALDRLPLVVVLAVRGSPAVARTCSAS